MNIVRARQISQTYFFLLFMWLSVVATVGEKWWEMRGWPVNWFLQLDPLVALGTLLTTGTLYAGLLWALVTIVMTILLGRFFCGWVCPLGTLQHVAGWLGSRGKSASDQIRRNQYRKAQSLKYVLLISLTGAGAAEFIGARGWVPSIQMSAVILLVIVVGFFLSMSAAARKKSGSMWKILQWVFLAGGIWLLLARFFSQHGLVGASLQTGLLDPLPLMHRSVSLVVLPLLDGAVHKLAVLQRFTAGAWLIAAVFTAIVLLSLSIPRFYCRFICPLGALFGILSRYALWRVGGGENACRECSFCERRCEGACEPAAEIRISECVLCMNCLETCRDGRMGYRTMPSSGGEKVNPDVSRRGFLVSLFSGVAAVPAMRLGGALKADWSPRLIRPPGSMNEEDFLRRCIKCGQCMRVCPTNIIHPALFEAGPEGFWSPVLNFRIGTSGCQYNCVVCGQVCPTAAIRPVSMGEKQGKGAFASTGPIRVGTAFVDRGRCLPWAMDRPCIVCQENCPVSPKAIFTREVFKTIRDGRVRVKAVSGNSVVTVPGGLTPGALATGDYFMEVEAGDQAGRRKIIRNTGDVLVVSPEEAGGGQWPEPGGFVDLQVRLKQPHVDLKHCIGCGICEHECPVTGRRAIRVTAENETRDKTHKLAL